MNSYISTNSWSKYLIILNSRRTDQLRETQGRTRRRPRRTRPSRSLGWPRDDQEGQVTQEEVNAFAIRINCTRLSRSEITLESVGTVVLNWTSLFGNF